MTDSTVNTVSNIDQKGHLRGKCNNPTCECDEYVKSMDNFICSMCGCYPAKHTIVIDSPVSSELSAKINDALSQMTPTKVAEIDICTGSVVVHSTQRESTEVQRTTKNLNFESPLENITETDAMGVGGQSSSPACEGTPGGNKNQEHDDENRVLVDDSNGLQQGSLTVSKRRKIRTTPRISPNTVKKDFLSYDLKEKIRKTNLLSNENAFISESASYLLALIQGENPTQEEFDIFCEKIVSLYPDLQSNIGKQKWSSFKTTVSRHLIQRRFRAKQEAKSGKTPKTVQSCTLVDDEEMDTGEDTVAVMMKKLREVTPESPVEYVLNLIASTSAARRALLNNEEKSQSPKELMQLWPHLSVADWLIYDFFSFKAIQEKDFLDNATTLLRRLAKLYEKEEDQKGFVKSLHKLALQMNNNRKQSKKIANVLTIIEALDPLECLQPVDTESPRLVFALLDDDIGQCFLLLDGQKCELENSTAQRAIACLMAAYYVFDIQYPTPYVNFLTVLDVETLNKSGAVKPSQRTLTHFYQKIKKIEV